MKDNDASAENLPADDHLREDVSLPSDGPADTADEFAPGQTNAGQQVAGLASAPHYGKDQDPEAGTDSNNPV